MQLGRILLYGLSALALAADEANGPAEAEIQQHMAAAAKAEQSRDYAHAAEEYKKVLRLRPNSAIVHQRVGLTYHLQNEFSRAVPEFVRAVELDSNLWGSFLFLGMDYYKLNQFEKAIPALEKSLSLNAAQTEPEARFWLGASHAALGRPERAIREYRRALELRPKDVEVLYQLAGMYDQQASALFAQIGKIEPRAAAVSLLQAEHSLEEGRADLARVDYQRAIRMRPDFGGAIPALEKEGAVPPDAGVGVSESDARATFSLAAYWLMRGDRARAGDVLAGLAKQKPADDGARKYIARARQAREGGMPATSLPAGEGRAWAQLLEARKWAESNQCSKAVESLEELLQRDAANLDAMLASGKTYKRWAELLLEQMIAIDPDSYRVRQLAGEQFEEKGAYDQAIASYREALAKKPDLAGARYAIGNVYWKIRQYDEAEHWLKEELRRNPRHGLTHYRLGSLYTEQRKADGAIVHLREALESHPEWTGARFDLGRALLLKGRYKDAAAALRQVAAEDPANDRVHYFLAEACRKLGRAADAQAELAKYHELTRKRLDRVQQSVRDVAHDLESRP